MIKSSAILQKLCFFGGQGMKQQCKLRNKMV